MIPKSTKLLSTKLTKCFFSTVHSDKATPYGISNNQIRSKGIINSAGWFNSGGERLGKGDLSLKDMATISQHIAKDDLFIALKETDSFHNMPIGLDYLAPGREYVLKNAVWVVGAGGVIIRVRDDVSKTEDIEQDGIKYVRMVKKDFLSASKAEKKVVVNDTSKDDSKPIPAKTAPVQATKPTATQSTTPATIAKVVAAPISPSLGGKAFSLPKKKTTIKKVSAAPAAKP
jgi:hypothetical protein